MLFCLSACVGKQNYSVSTATGAIAIDANSEDAWQRADTITAFINPWNNAVSPYTSLQMLQDEEYLYFQFIANDTDLVVLDQLTNERDIEKEDRVELFFSKDDQMKEYYCFEIDPKGRTLSYKASHYRQFDFDWEVPGRYSVAARITPNGYTVEGAIPLSFLKPLSANGMIYFGAYRAAFSIQNDVLVENWLTWIDPNVAEPDFHVPSSLTSLYFNK